MTDQDYALAKACCADLYQSPMALQILGDPPHPGGLGLTNRLGRLMGIDQGDWVLDLASAQGTSAMALSRVFHCNVVGVEFGGEAVASARSAAVESPAAPRAFFLRGDAERTPLAGDFFDGVICECSMSLFGNKAAAVSEAVRVMKPGANFGMTDVAVEPGTLPEELEGYLGQVLCLAQALNVPGYVQLLERGGLTITHRKDASDRLLDILNAVESKLGFVAAWQSITPLANADYDWLQRAPGLIQRLRVLVAEGKLGYWVFVGQKQGK